MTAQATYPIFCASPRRDCFVPLSSAARGSLVWSQGLGLAPEVAPLHLLSWGEQVVVVTHQQVHVHGPDGGRRWSRSRLSSTFVAARGDRLYLLNDEGELDVLGQDGGELIESSWVPMADEPGFNTTVPLFWPLPGGDEFLLAAQFMGTGAGGPPAVICYRNAIGADFGVWEHDVMGGLRLPPLYVPGTDRMLLATVEVTPVDCGQGTLGQPFAVPMSDPINWCADDSGNLYVIGTHEPQDPEQKVRGLLLALTPDGQERWRWSGSPNKVAWHRAQPPAAAADGTVFGVIAGAVLAFRDGDLAWDYEVSATAITALGDGTLLVTSGGQLLRLDPAGERMFRVDAGGPILTPPVVDGQGSVYIATDKRLVKIS